MTNRNVLHNTHNENIDLDEFHEMVAERAYHKAEQRGFVSGYETENWLAAEQELSKLYDYMSQLAE